MQNGIFRICNGKITDSEEGDNTGYYDHNENYIMTLSMPGAKSISLKFNAFCTELDNDILSIFDGKDTNATLIGRYSGSSGPSTVKSTDSFITLHFISDKSVACTGWDAQVINDIIPPTAAKFSIKSVINCLDSVIDILLDKFIVCDSFNIYNTDINGLTIKSINPFNSSDTLSNRFLISIDGGIQKNGTYTINHTHGYRDYCDSVYFLNSKLNFSIKDCPIFVELTSTADTICRGDCIRLSASATGGQSSLYKYKWNLSSIPDTSIWDFCPTATTNVVVTVSDGNAIPDSDSITIVVLDPPKAQNDTQLCYYGDNILLKASPSGGYWTGPGIVDSKKGEFKPYGQWGYKSVVYHIGDCTDTVVIYVYRPYCYENVFCPGNTPLPVYWYGPPGGYWTGENIDSIGRYLPDSSGTFTVTYHWQGCSADKTIVVEEIDVPAFDTTCESVIRDTLNFEPKGLIPSYFKGIVNYYWGWYNPSMMGGPGNYNIVYRGRGSCSDTTQLTVLPCYAGLDDTICPSVAAQKLTGFRASPGYLWEGLGIVDPKSGIYDPSFTKNDYVDTLVLKTKFCTDTKLVYIINTRIEMPDTLEVCNDWDSVDLSNIFKTSVPGGVWSGITVKFGKWFYPNKLSPGYYSVGYKKNNCEDFATIKVLPAPLIMNDTHLCEDVNYLNLLSKEPGKYYGDYIWGNSMQRFYPKSAGKGLHEIGFLSDRGCRDTMLVLLDSLTTIDKTQLPSVLCFNSSVYNPVIKPLGGKYIINLDTFSNWITSNWGSGNHLVKYHYSEGLCISKDSFTVKVLDTLKVIPIISDDSVCYGESIVLQANGFGGNGNYTFDWSHGQSGAKVFANPSQNTNYIVTISDGCSDNDNDEIDVVIHPRMWLDCITSAPVCYGNNGFIYVQLQSGNESEIIWDYPGIIVNDTFFAPSGSWYKAFISDAETGCFTDTNIYIDGFSAVQADFILPPPISGNCYSPLDKSIVISDASLGASKGQWILNGQYFADYSVNPSPIVGFDANLSTHSIELIVENDGGCKDTANKNVCFRDTVIIYMPNAFSPDGNSLNDEYKWFTVGATEVNVLVYNRWGEIVFESKDVNGSWDGCYKNVDCPEGVYLVYIEYRGNKKARRQKVQSVLLMRDK